MLGLWPTCVGPAPTPPERGGISSKTGTRPSVTDGVTRSDDADPYNIDVTYLCSSTTQPDRRSSCRRTWARTISDLESNSEARTCSASSPGIPPSARTAFTANARLSS
jgi:hypothetical protein